MVGNNYKSQRGVKKQASVTLPRAKAMTFVEVLVSLIIVTMTMMAIINIVFTIYKANIFISAMLNVDAEAAYVKGYLETFIQGANPRSIDCTVDTTKDYNNDGTNDQRLLRFIGVDDKEYHVVRLINLTNPVRPNSTYNPLLLVLYNPDTTSIIPLNMLTSPLIDTAAPVVRCSPLIEVPEKGYDIRGVNIEFTFETVFKYSDIIGRGGAKPIISDYRIVVSKAAIN